MYFSDFASEVLVFSCALLAPCNLPSYCIINTLIKSMSCYNLSQSYFCSNGIFLVFYNTVTLEINLKLTVEMFISVRNGGRKNKKRLTSHI